MLAAVLLAACGGADKARSTVTGTTLTVYSSMPLEGPDRAAAVDIVRAERLALMQAGSTVGRYRIGLVSLDAATPKAAASDPAQISLNARRAAGDMSAIAYIGELDPGSSAISIPLLNEAGLLEVSPLDTAMDLTVATPAIPGSPLKYYPNLQKAGRTFARLAPNDRAQATAAVGWMAQVGVRKLAVLTDDDTTGLPLAGAVQSRATAAGMTLLDENEDVDAHALDQRALAERVAAKGVDAVFYAGSTRPGIVALWKALVAADPGIKLFTPAAVAEKPFLAAIGPQADRATYVTRPELTLSAYPPAAQQLAAEFRAAYGYVPRSQALYGYEAMRTVLAAIGRAEADHGDRAINRTDVVRAYFQTRVAGSVLGDFAIRSDGDTTIAAYGAYRVGAGGRLRFVRTLGAATP